MYSKKRTRYPPPKKHPIECKSSGTGTYPCRMYSSSQTPLCPKQKNFPRVRQEDKKHTKAVLRTYVHYRHVVPVGSSVPSIANRRGYDTSFTFHF